jgi:phage replication initiation protein
MATAESRAQARREHAARKDEHGARSSALEPRRVTRGETSKGTIAHIDWFACTFKPTSSEFFDVFAAVFRLPRSDWKPRPGGWQGYEKRVDLGTFGLLAYGGDAQRGTAHLELNAHGCARIEDWNAVRLWCDTYVAKITRLDLAHDDLSGQTVNIEQAVAWLDEGGFNSGGREPETSTAGDWLRKSRGRTLYVGKRKNGKLCRVYEKGKQLGDLKSPWCRVEVEFRAKSRMIPLDALTRPDDYLSGAYPCLAYLSQHQDKVRTLSKQSEIGYAQLIRCVRMQYGPALSVMAQVEGGDACAVLEQVMRPGVPKRLANLPAPRGESRQDGTT